MIVIHKDTVKDLIDLYHKKRISLEGNILKVIKSDDAEFIKYLDEAKVKDAETRRKRLEVTKQVQQQNKDLIQSQQENQLLMVDLQNALDDAKKAKSEAEKLRDAAVEDLEVLQKRKQFELINLIVKVALAAVGAVCVFTSLLYMYVLSKGLDAKIIESTWSNMFGIILTNCFSIIGTIMGVKHVTEQKK